MTYDNELRGVLFKVRDKRHEKAPDYTGTVTVDGKEWSIGGWLRKSAKGTSFLSLKLSEKMERKKQSEPEDLDDDIPFSFEDA